MPNNPTLRVQQILLIGTGRTYEISLTDGVNVIAGPIFTGKSSVLQLIDYVCGSNSRPTYHEIQKCSSVLVQFEIDSEIFTVQRSLTDDNANVLLYECSINKVMTGNESALDLSARQTQPGQTTLSSEIMKRLYMDHIAVKTAPSQNASSTSTFSLRDLFSLLYVDQDRMGQKSAFFEKDTFRRIKWKAGFEIVHFLFDEASTSLSLSLKDAEKEYSRIENYLASVNTFLNQSSVPKRVKIEQELIRLRDEQTTLEAKLVRSEKVAAQHLGEDREFFRQQEDLENSIRLSDSQLRETRQTLGQMGKLLVQYGRERKQLEFLEETQLAISPLPIVRCPSCFQPVKESLEREHCHVCTQTLPQENESVAVQARLRAVRRRVKDLQTYISELNEEERHLANNGEMLRKDLIDLNAKLSRLQTSLLQPQMKVSIELHSAINEIMAKRSSLEESLRLREKAEGHDSNLLRARGRIQSLKDELKEAESKRKSPDEVIEKLTLLFSEAMAAVKFPALGNPHIDKDSYLPMIRGQAYSALSSKGALSVAESVWHLVILQYALENESLYPRFLMLDSPLMQVGRDSSDDEFKDQQIVDAFYGWLFELHEKHAPNFQLLIVDNRPPKSANELVSVRFTRGLEGRYGLIEDEVGELEPELGDLGV